MAVRKKSESSRQAADRPHPSLLESQPAGSSTSNQTNDQASERNQRILKERDAIRLLAKVAEEYWINERSQSVIGKDPQIFGNKPRQASTIARLLAEARRQGVVDFQVDYTFGIIGREDDDLSQKLRDDFHLLDAVVVAVDLLEPFEYAEDDYLHTALANHAGMHFRVQIRPADHIAVSGGRAVYQAVSFVKRRPPRRTNIRVTPLSGRVWAHAWQLRGPTLTRPLDPDDAAFILASAFEKQPGTSFSQIGAPLFADSPKEAQDLMEHCYFRPDGTWRSEPGIKPPRVALIGVGALQGGHRLAKWLSQKQDPSSFDQYLRRAADEVNDIMEYVRKNELEVPGDVGNRLFPALPFPNKVVNLSPDRRDRLGKAYDELNKRLNQLNSKTVGANWPHLRIIENVIAIGGGTYKLNAVWTLLLTGYLEALINEASKEHIVSELSSLAPDQKLRAAAFRELEQISHKRIVTELYTEAGTARMLLDQLKNFKSANAETIIWYLSRIRGFF